MTTGRSAGATISGCARRDRRRRLLIATVAVLACLGAQVDQQSDQPGSAPATSPARSEPQPEGRLDGAAAALPIDAGAVRQMCRQAGPAARWRYSPHFIVVYTSDTRLADELRERLEAVYQAHLRLSQKLGVPLRRPAYKLEVYLFASHQEFMGLAADRAKLPEKELGFYDPASNRCFFFDLSTYPPLAALQAEVEQTDPAPRSRLLSRLQRRREALLSSVVQHEAAHQIQFNLGLIPSFQDVPTWLAEGLAMLFEPTFDSAGQPREPTNAYRLYEFKKLYGSTTRTPPDLGRFLIDEQAWCGGPCYPLAWAVTAYLQQEHPDGLAALLRSLATGGRFPVDPSGRRALLEEWFGPIDQRWIERFYATIMHQPLSGSAFAD